ncbi:MAG: hypothetical protein HUJ75_03205, partial [Parasporobacterium sp.]|nr:hypothetical protein [Parasporobacterium sp.]
MEMELYQQIKAGNKEVIKNVYKENAKDVYNFAKSITGDHESALEATKKAFVTLFTQIRNDEYPINIRLGAMKIAYDEACSMTMASKSDAESPYNADYVNKLSFEETASEDTTAASAGQEAAAFGAAAGAAFAFNNAGQYDAPSMNYAEQPVMFDAYGQPVPVMNAPYGQQTAYPMNYDAPAFVTQDINGNVFYNTPQSQAFNQAPGAFNPYNNNQMYAQAPAALGSLPDENGGAVNPAVNNMFYNNGAGVYGQPFNNGTNIAFGGQPAQFNGGQPVNFTAQPMMYNNAGQPMQPMNYGAQPMMYNNAGQPVQPMNYGAQPMMYNNAGQPVQPMNYGAQPMMYNNAGQPVQPMNYSAQPMMYNNGARPVQPVNSGAQGMMYNNAVQPGQPAEADTQAADNDEQPVINPFMSNAAMAAAAASAMNIDEEVSAVQPDSDESIPESVGSMFYTD